MLRGPVGAVVQPYSALSPSKTPAEEQVPRGSTSTLQLLRQLVELHLRTVTWVPLQLWEAYWSPIGKHRSEGNIPTAKEVEFKPQPPAGYSA